MVLWDKKPAEKAHTHLPHGWAPALCVPPSRRQPEAPVHIHTPFLAAASFQMPSHRHPHFERSCQSCVFNSIANPASFMQSLKVPLHLFIPFPWGPYTTSWDGVHSSSRCSMYRPCEQSLHPVKPVYSPSPWHLIHTNCTDLFLVERNLKSLEINLTFHRSHNIANPKFLCFWGYCFTKRILVL